MLTVSLAGVRFDAPVGLYSQEVFTGNKIEISISVSQAAPIDDLPLIDYTLLHRIASDALQEPAALLETIVQRIVHNIGSLYPERKVKVAVRKLNPPMPGEVQYAEVQWES